MKLLEDFLSLLQVWAMVEVMELVKDVSCYELEDFGVVR